MAHNISKQTWKVHTPNLLSEILSNPGTGILEKPVKIFSILLAKVSERAIELDDKELNKLMIRLTLYENADPENPEYDSDEIKRYLES